MNWWQQHSIGNYSLRNVAHCEATVCLTLNHKIDSFPRSSMLCFLYVYTIDLSQLLRPDRKCWNLDNDLSSSYLITSRRPSAIMNISLATSPFRQMRSPGVKMNAFIFSTRSWRNSGSHSWNIVTCNTVWLFWPVSIGGLSFRICCVFVKMANHWF